MRNSALQTLVQGQARQTEIILLKSKLFVFVTMLMPSFPIRVFIQHFYTYICQNKFTESL